MKRTIQNNKLLFYSSIFSIAAFLLATNFVSLERKPTFTSRPAQGVQQLKLVNQTLVKHRAVSPFSSIKIASQFLDTIIFEPASKSHLEIKGDQSLVNNLVIYRQTNHELVIERKYAYWVDQLKERASYDFNFNGTLAKGGLSIKVYYTELKDITIYGQAKLIVQKGTLRGSKVFIDACAEKAFFNVEATNLELYLSKPQFWMDSLGKMVSLFPTLDPKGFQTITGKADLVQVNGHYGSSWVDLGKLQCRHVHGVFTTGGGTKKLIAAPSQLLSYLGYKRLPDPDVEIICKSKAKVSYAYEDARSRKIVRMR